MGTIIHDDIIYGGGQADLPIASASELGGIKVGNNLSIDSNGVLSGRKFEMEKFYYESDKTVFGSNIGIMYPIGNYNRWTGASTQRPDLEVYGYFNINGRTISELVDAFSCLYFAIGGGYRTSNGTEYISGIQASCIIPLDLFFNKDPDSDTVLLNYVDLLSERYSEGYEKRLKTLNSSGNEEIVKVVLGNATDKWMLTYKSDINKIELKYNSYYPIRPDSGTSYYQPGSQYSVYPLCYGIKR